MPVDLLGNPVQHLVGIFVCFDLVALPQNGGWRQSLSLPGTVSCLAASGVRVCPLPIRRQEPKTQGMLECVFDVPLDSQCWDGIGELTSQVQLQDDLCPYRHLFCLRSTQPPVPLGSASLWFCYCVPCLCFKTLPSRGNKQTFA